jgi:hypothetical protein
MNYKNVPLLILIIFSIGTIFSCSSNSKKQDAVDEYSAVINKFYQLAQKRDYSAMSDLCHKYWYKYWDYEKTIHYFAKINDLEGNVIKWEITFSDNKGDFTGNGLEGEQVQIIVKVTREYVNTEEMFVLYREKGNNNFGILTYSLSEDLPETIVDSTYNDSVL